jgi:DNA adenine methylase
MTSPIVPWPGGKRRLAKQILPHFPPHDTYVELFAGGAALFFLRPEPAKCEVLNDLHRELVCLYRCVQHHLEELVRQFRWALVSREMFRWAQLQHVDTLTDIQRAARFFYLQKLAFGGKVSGQTFGTDVRPRMNLLRIEEDLSAAHLRLSRTTIECLPWQDCMRRYDRPGTLFFADPPYWETEGYGRPFELEQYEQLAEAMRSCKGRVILTINDHPEMRRVFGGFEHQRVDIKYTMAQGAAKRAGELVVQSMPTSRSSSSSRG